MKTIITKKFDFEAAHHLPWHQGKCKTLHGHSYKLEVSVSGNLNENGVIIDFGDLKKIVNEIILEIYDHKNLNDYFKNPTAEIMAQTFFGNLQAVLPSIIRVERVRLYETANAFVDVERL